VGDPDGAVEVMVHIGKYVSDYVRLPMSDAARAALRPGGPNVLAVHCHQTIGGQFIDVGIAEAGE